MVDECRSIEEIDNSLLNSFRAVIIALDTSGLATNERINLLLWYSAGVNDALLACRPGFVSNIDNRISRITTDFNLGRLPMDIAWRNIVSLVQ